MTADEWLDRQSEVPDGDGFDRLEDAKFERDDDPELYDAIKHYVAVREPFDEAASALIAVMEARGWEAR